jgi:hypothetical protein
MMKMARPCLLAALLCAACDLAAPAPEGPAPVSDGGPVSDGAAVKGAATRDANAIPAFTDGGSFACPQKVTCPAFEVDSRVGDPPKLDLEAARCAFRALRDHTPGLIEYVANDVTDQDVVRHRLHLLPDGTIYEEQDRDYDGRAFHTTRHFVSPPPDYFTRCLTESDPYRAEGCLSYWKDAFPVTVPVACEGSPPAGGYPRPDDPYCPHTCVEEAHQGAWSCTDVPAPCSDKIGATAITCALEAFRDGKEGWYSVRMETNTDFHGYDTFSIIVRPGRLGLATREMAIDVSVQQMSYAGKLRDPAYFTSCLANGAPGAHLDCFTNAATGTCQ